MVGKPFWMAWPLHGSSKVGVPCQGCRDCPLPQDGAGWRDRDGLGAGGGGVRRGLRGVLGACQVSTVLLPFE
jgi:hypothetical protein